MLVHLVWRCIESFSWLSSRLCAPALNTASAVSPPAQAHRVQEIKKASISHWFWGVAPTFPLPGVECTPGGVCWVALVIHITMQADIWCHQKHLKSFFSDGRFIFFIAQCSCAAVDLFTVTFIFSPIVLLLTWTRESTVLLGFKLSGKCDWVVGICGTDL